MIDDFRRSISAILHERTTSPLYGTFIFSWLVINWKITLAVFYGGEWDTLQSKTQFISQQLNWYDGLLYPVLSTIVVIYGGTLLSNFVYNWYAKKQFERVEKKKVIEKNQLLSVEDSVKIMNEVETLKLNFNNLLKDRDSKIERLEINLANVKGNSEQLQDTIKQNEKEKINMGQDIAAKDAKIARYQKDIQNLNITITEQLANIDSLKQQVKQLNLDNTELNEEINQIKSQKENGYTESEIDEIVHKIVHSRLSENINHVLTYIYTNKRPQQLEDRSLNYWYANDLIDGNKLTKKGKAVVKVLANTFELIV